MNSKNKNSLKVLAVAMACAVIFASGCAACRNKKSEAQPQGKKDSIEKPEPLAPPIIYDHSWREELNKQE